MKTETIKTEEKQQPPDLTQLRDTFAGMAMQGLMTQTGRDPLLIKSNATGVAEAAYMIADAMLERRAVTN